MKYTFEAQILDIDEHPYYSINVEEKLFYTIGRFSDSGWTPTKIQKIIDGLEQSKTKPKGEEFLWGNEDVNLYANENGVLLIDVMAQRAKQYDPDVITLRLTHEEIINFLQDFKKFVEENS
ncbi:hypothetical protein HNP38_002250 [Chryseobacterium defluvii]|uniref:Uncharacterized protein n=1 Tax=Chryseobacterium defluvii TaxID=160396 RepID=A0A840KGX4_9FLAO|nr:hypothetical protein [Chryseobacterium defluvii]MBB4806954.1 hypothetical protein [Chryseobacterium defluvii]